eukprot:4937136-Prymnesium_polylepis.1
MAAVGGERGLMQLRAQLSRLRHTHRSDRAFATARIAAIAPSPQRASQRSRLLSISSRHDTRRGAPPHPTSTACARARPSAQRSPAGDRAARRRAARSPSTARSAARPSSSTAARGSAAPPRPDSRSSTHSSERRRGRRALAHSRLLCAPAAAAASGRARPRADSAAARAAAWAPRAAMREPSASGRAAALDRALGERRGPSLPLQQCSWQERTVSLLWNRPPATRPAVHPTASTPAAAIARAGAEIAAEAPGAEAVPGRVRPARP